MDQVKIGAFIARLRREKGWTQEKLGERLGVTNKTVSRWKTGTYMPGVEMLTLLGRELDVTLNELLEGRRLEGDDFRAAADERLAAAMLSPGERARQWLARYGGFTAVTLVLCVVLGTVIWADWRYREGHPEDVGTEHATLYVSDWRPQRHTLFHPFPGGVLYLYGRRGISGTGQLRPEWGRAQAERRRNAALGHYQGQAGPRCGPAGRKTDYL